MAGRPVGWPLPGSAELPRAARRALRRHRSRAEAPPRWHTDHARGPMANPNPKQASVHAVRAGMPTLELQALLVSWEVRPHGQSAPLASAPARLLRLLRARLAALGSSALPGGGQLTGRPTTASGARASRLQSCRFHALDPPGATHARAGRGAAGGPRRPRGAPSPLLPITSRGVLLTG